MNRVWDVVGNLEILPIGLDIAIDIDPKPIATVVQKQDLPPLLPSIRRTRHKYERGNLAIFAGTLGMTGAAFLASLGGFKGGAGIVHLFTDQGLEPAFFNLPQLIVKPFSPYPDLEKFDAIVLGPGLGRDLQKGKLVNHVIETFKGPIVIDGDAIYHVSTLHLTLSKQTILTPHGGELCQLTGEKIDERNSNWIDRIQSFTNEKKCHLIAKGAPTFFFSPNSLPQIIPFGDPGMATAGSGDLLAGILGGLLAQKISIPEGVVLGTGIHGLSGELSASKTSSQSMDVNDIAKEIGNVLLSLEERLI